MSFLATLSANDVVAQYVAAYQAVQTYTSSIGNIGPPGDASSYPNWQAAQAALLQGKQAALDWPNRVAAPAKEVPASITNWDPELAGLIANLKVQAQPPLTDAKKKQIAADANNILKILGQKAGEFSGLVTDLSSLAGALSQAHTTITGCHNAIQNDIGNYRNTRSQLIGKLQAEGSKICPSHTYMRQLQNEILQQQAQTNAAIDWENTVDQVYNLAVEAVPSAQFLQGFWQGIGEGIAQASAAAKKLPQDPSGVLLLDIQQIANTWSRVQQEMAKISQQLP